MSLKKRVAIVVSHPIQHFCPQYVSLAENADIHLKVFFASALGLKSYLDPGFQQQISWGNLHLELFEHTFMNGQEIIQPDKNIDAPELSDELKVFRPDVVIIYGYFQKLQRRARNWAIQHGVPLAYISDSEKKQKRNWLKEILKFPIIHRYFSKIDFFLSVGNSNEEFYRSYGVKSDKIIRMHFPIDINHYAVSYDKKYQLKESVRKRYGIRQDENVCCVVGKLVSWKNQDHLVYALKLLEERGIYLNLFIIGSGEMQAVWQTSTKSLKRSRVFFTGFVGIEKLPDYYAAADFYAHPASVEPHSIAISEAIYMGLPVILSDRCGSYGISDDVQVGSNGEVYPFGNIPALADKIEKLISNKILMEEMSKQSHAISVDFQLRSHKTFMTELLSRINRN